MGREGEARETFLWHRGLKKRKDQLKPTVDHDPPPTERGTNFKISFLFLFLLRFLFLSGHAIWRREREWD